MVWIPIPTGLMHRYYSTRVSGQVPKLVKCEECGLEYVYFLEGSAEGVGVSPFHLDNQGAQELAQELAVARLHLQAEHHCAVIPCMACGHVQRHMFDAVRDELRPGMRQTGVSLIVIAAV